MPQDVVSCELCQASPGWNYVPDAKGIVRVQRCRCYWRATKPYANGVPDPYREASFKTYRKMSGNKTALEVAQAWSGGSRDLYVAGGIGSGKTLLACAILNHTWQTQHVGYFARVPMVLQKMQPSLTDDKTQSTLFNTLTSEPVLVLDDVGSERDQASDYTRRTLLLIAEERADAKLRTIWTSNYRLAREQEVLVRDVTYEKTLGEFMGDDRLASRIAGRSDVVWIGCSDQRVRRQKAETA